MIYIYGDLLAAHSPGTSNFSASESGESSLCLEWGTLDQTKMETRQESIGLRTKEGYEVVRGGTEERALEKKGFCEG